MNLEEYAIQELGLYFNIESKEDIEVRKCVLDLIQILRKQEHSGNSAMFIINIFNKLAQYKPLTPLTGNFYEWVKITDDLEQNTRCFAVFRTPDMVYYNDAFIWLDSSGHTFTNYKSRHPIVFPFVPKSFYIKVDDSDDRNPINEEEKEKLEKAIQYFKTPYKDEAV